MNELIADKKELIALTPEIKSWNRQLISIAENREGTIRIESVEDNNDKGYVSILFSGPISGNDGPWDASVIASGNKWGGPTKYLTEEGISAVCKTDCGMLTLGSRYPSGFPQGWPGKILI